MQNLKSFTKVLNSLCFRGFKSFAFVEAKRHGVESQKDCKHLSGFTLIELLVVISIIAVLMSILMPSLGAARSQARRVVCAARLRNIGTAMTMYTATNEGYLPYGYCAEKISGYTGWPTWEDFLVSMLSSQTDTMKNWEVYQKNFYCSEDKKWEDERLIQFDAKGYSTSYCFNYDTLIVVHKGQELRPPMRVTKFRTLSRNMLLACGGGVEPRPWIYGDTLELSPGYERHRGQCNFLFADGHVSQLSPKSAQKDIAHKTVNDGRDVVLRDF